ncbi:hypothetical protein [Desulfurobacterium sp.]|uniref:hypothetical protein n=1 Tax=Desulfurobacterium sp. TaxID=2004706 RepID=UPI00260F13F4|nr:hypothetical protein [Desulfurobacterium sp.]
MKVMVKKIIAIFGIYLTVFCFLLTAHASSLFVYFQFEGVKKPIKIGSISIENKTLTLNKTFNPTETQKQFLLGTFHLKGKIHSIKMNDKIYTLVSALNIKDNSVKAVFIKATKNGIYVAPQNLLSVKDKVLFSIPDKNAVGVIDGDSGLVAGFIGFNEKPSGIGMIGDRIYVGFKGLPIVSVLSMENGFPVSDISIPGAGSAEIESLKGNLYILSASRQNLFIYDTLSGTLNSIHFHRKVSDFFINNATNSILTADGGTGNINIFSLINGRLTGTVTIPGNIVSVCGDRENIYAADSFTSSIIKYSLLSKTSDSEDLPEEPLKLRISEHLLFVTTPSKVIALDTFSLNPYLAFNINKSSEILIGNDKLFIFSKTGKYFIINKSSLSVETVGDIPGAVFQAASNKSEG